jgi:hypothetical protein
VYASRGEAGSQESSSLFGKSSEAEAEMSPADVVPSRQDHALRLALLATLYGYLGHSNVLHRSSSPDPPRNRPIKTVGIPDHGVGIDDRQPNPLIPRRVTAKFDSGAVEFINRLGLLKNTMAPICLKSRHIQARKSAEFGIRRALTEDRKVGRI